MQEQVISNPVEDFERARISRDWRRAPITTIWAVWHYPELLWTDYNPGTNAAFALACFTVMVVALAYIMGYLRVRSGSIWPCVLLHATHNIFVQDIFDPLTAPVGWAKYITTEFGVGLAVAIVAAGTVIVSAGRPRKELPCLDR